MAAVLGGKLQANACIVHQKELQICTIRCKHAYYSPFLFDELKPLHVLPDLLRVNILFFPTY